MLDPTQPIKRHRTDPFYVVDLFPENTTTIEYFTVLPSDNMRETAKLMSKMNKFNLNVSLFRTMICMECRQKSFIHISLTFPSTLPLIIVAVSVWQNGRHEKVFVPPPIVFIDFVVCTEYFAFLQKQGRAFWKVEIHRNFNLSFSSCEILNDL